MQHSFCVEIAELLSIDEAILLSHIAHWVYKNQCNNTNFKNGKYWTYNSSSGFQEIFPYYTSTKIARIMRKLESEGYIESACLDINKYNRTKWYTLTEKGRILCEKHSLFRRKNTEHPPKKDELSTVQNCKIDNSISNEETMSKNAYSKTDIHTNNKTNNKTHIYTKCKLDFDSISSNCKNCWNINKCTKPIDIPKMYLDENHVLDPVTATMLIEDNLACNPKYDLQKRIENGVLTNVEEYFLYHLIKLENTNERTSR